MGHRQKVRGVNSPSDLEGEPHAKRKLGGTCAVVRTSCKVTLESSEETALLKALAAVRDLSVMHPWPGLPILSAIEAMRWVTEWPN